MNKSNEILRVFIAMPGDMTNAAWKSSQEVKQYFFEPIRKKLEEVTHRSTILFYETDKDETGSIYTSMFSEAWEAEVYIADLTGNNPNVYLELGVRWASKDNITVIVGQNVEVEPLKFNVAASRAIRYGEGAALREKAINRVVQSIKYGLDDKGRIDSLVREKGDLKSISLKELTDLKDRVTFLEREIENLKSSQGLEYLEAAKSLIEQKDHKEAIELLRKALGINETLVEAHYYLGKELRLVGGYTEAISVLQQGISLNAKLAKLYRELGVSYNKNGMLAEGVDALDKAVTLDPKDEEAWNNRGGGYRRLGMRKPLDWNALHKARDSYKEALQLKPYDLYSLGNVAKLDLILSKIEPDNKLVVMSEFEQLKHLSDYEAGNAPNDYWRLFDRADAYLLSGDIEKGNQYYLQAMKAVDKETVKSTFSSVAGPLKDFIVTEVLEEPVKSAVQNIIEKLEHAIRNVEESS